MNEYKDWIVRFYASHKDIPKGHSDCETLKELVRCKDCKHRFEGEKFSNCCEVLMEMSQWLVEIPVKDDWHCGSGEREEE